MGVIGKCKTRIFLLTLAAALAWACYGREAETESARLAGSGRTSWLGRLADPAGHGHPIASAYAERRALDGACCLGRSQRRDAAGGEPG